MRIKPRERLQREKPEPLAVPEAADEIWSMDFMADQLDCELEEAVPALPRRRVNRSHAGRT